MESQQNHSYTPVPRQQEKVARRDVDATLEVCRSAQTSTRQLATVTAARRFHEPRDGMMNVLNVTAQRLSMCLLAGVWCVGATPASAQDRYVTVDYMKVAPGGDDGYLQLERRLEAGARGPGESRQRRRLVPVPGAVAQRQRSGSQLRDRGPLQQLRSHGESVPHGAAHAGAPWREHDGLLHEDKRRPGPRALRDVAVGRPNSGRAAGHAGALLDRRIHAGAAGGDDAYLAVEKLWRKIHEVRIKEGTMSNWGLLTRVFPGGSDHPYGYATINGYSRFKDIVGLDLAGLTTRATLGMSVDELGDKTVKSRDLARGELWLLVGYVQAPATTRTPSP